MFDILAQVNEWLGQGKPIALATVVETWGSAPRRVGSKMGIAADLAMVGSVSGGCVETAVVEEALKALKRGRPRLLEYGVSDDDAWQVGLACGGRISVWVEPLDTGWWPLAAQAATHDESLTTLTILAGEHAGAKIALDGRAEIVYSSGGLPPEQRGAFVGGALPRQSGRGTLAGYDVMVDVIAARPHLVIVGGVHIATCLQHFARLLGFRVTLIDPRDAFATEERFPSVDGMIHAYPDKALAQVGIDGNTYIAILTHDPKIDDPALKTALAAKPAYIGALGSKRTHAKRLERLSAAGVDANEFARLSTPIGLPIAAGTPEEIALAVMAQIVAVKNGASQAVAS